MISKLMPPTRMVWLIMAAGLAFNIRGTAAPGLVVTGAEHSPERHRVVLDLDVFGCGADHLDVAVLIAVLHLEPAFHLGNDGLEQPGVPEQRLVIVGAEDGAVGDPDSAAH